MSWRGLFTLGLGAILAGQALVAPVSAAETDFGAVDRYVEAERRAQSIPGIALAVVQGDRIVHQQGFGSADASGRPVTPRTPFVIGSLTKSFTALAVMQLVEAGRLDLEAPVQRYLSWFRVADPDASARITLRHLLHQTSGLSTATGNERIADGDADDGALERRVRALRGAELTRPVGEAYQYSNANYAVLGLVVQTVSGHSYEQYVEQRVFAPLGMRRSFTSKEEARPHGLASGHRFWFGVPRPSDLPVPRGDLPAGFLVSTAEDMGRYLLANLNGGRLDGTAVLSPAGLAELHRPAVEAGGPDAHYAMGWSVVRDGDVTVLGHSGETMEFRSFMGLVPERGFGYVVLLNADTAFGRNRMAGIGEGVYGLLLGREVSATPSGATPQAILYGVLAAVVAVQVAATARSIRTVRRWRAAPERRPAGRRATLRGIGLPLALNAAWAAATLLLLPRAVGVPIGVVLQQMPDVGTVLVASGVVAAAWAVARTGLVAAAPAGRGAASQQRKAQ